MTTTQTQTLAAWLLEQIEADEAVARAAISAGSPRWEVRGERVEVAGYVGEWDAFSCTIVFDEGSPSADQAAHIARHDPARVLAECAAKRRIVDRAEHVREQIESLRYDEGEDQTTLATAAYELAHSMRALASVYADAPGWRSEWSL
jgi:hypothetical protein